MIKFRECFYGIAAAICFFMFLIFLLSVAERADGENPKTNVEVTGGVEVRQLYREKERPGFYCGIVSSYNGPGDLYLMKDPAYGKEYLILKYERGYGSSVAICERNTEE